MKTTTLIASAARCAAVLLTSLTTLAVRAAEQHDYHAIAESIVGQSANVKEGDRVVIRGDVRDIELIEQLSLAVWRRGAEPMQVLGRERSALAYFEQVPAKMDAMPSAWGAKLAEFATVEINVAGTEFPDQLNKVAPERLAAIEKREVDVMNARFAKGVRGVEVGNGLYPTEATAKRFGLSKKQLADIYWSGLSVDYTKLQTTGAAVKAVLANGQSARITHANGTDFTVQLHGRPVFVSDGVISAEDMAQGGVARQVWLPAGEVYLVPVAGSAEGKIVVDRIPYEGGEVLGATFTLKGGKMISHSAQAGPAYERWQARYALADDSKNELGVIDLGINPNVKVPAGSKLTTWVPAGTVSVVFGNNVWAGGTNRSPWNSAASLNGCTVVVDGKTVVDKGVLKL